MSLLKFLIICSGGEEVQILGFLVPTDIYTALGFYSAFRAVVLPSYFQ